MIKNIAAVVTFAILGTFFFIYGWMNFLAAWINYKSISGLIIGASSFVLSALLFLEENEEETRMSKFEKSKESDYYSFETKKKVPFYKSVLFWCLIAIAVSIFNIVSMFGQRTRREDFHIPLPVEQTLQEGLATPPPTAEFSINAEPPKYTMGQYNAMKKASSYLRFSNFSKQGLIEQLEFEGFSFEDSYFAVENCGADWNEQALGKAKSYLKYSAFSYEGLRDQLDYEGFTREESFYGVENCGADWFEQAALKAESYLKYSSFSKKRLIEQLEYEGFSTEEAEYGAAAVGY